MCTKAAGCQSDELRTPVQKETVLPTIYHVYIIYMYSYYETHQGLHQKCTLSLSHLSLRLMSALRPWLAQQVLRLKERWPIHLRSNPYQILSFQHDPQLCWPALTESSSRCLLN